MSERAKPYLFAQEADDGQRVELVQLMDDRQIAIKRSGYGEHTVIDFHGSPGSRNNLVPRAAVLYTLNVNVITFDRPGYGDSTRNPGRTVADSASDVEQVADALGIERFGVRAQSGGAPHALGTAALLGDRVTGIVCSAGLAPREANPDWDVMTSYNQEKHRLAREDPQALAARLEPYVNLLRGNTTALLDDIFPSFNQPDSELIQRDYVLAQLIAFSHKAGLERGIGGWVDDILALNQESDEGPYGWSFNPGDIKSPAIFWHGEQDPFADPTQSYTLRDLVPMSASVSHPEMGHFGALLQAEKALAYIRDCAAQQKQTGRMEQLPADEIERLFTMDWFHIYRRNIRDPSIPNVVMHGSGQQAS